MSQASQVSLDYEGLAESLKALAYPMRLALLDTLAVPRTLSEIRIMPRRTSAGVRAERPASMQTVLAHLERLVDVGLVTTGRAEIRGKSLETYAVDPQRLYALTEELRRLSVKHTGRGRSLDETGTMLSADNASIASGARAVVVHGAYEGRPFPLRSGDGSNGWLIGRKKGVDVCLDYDPFVSLENSRIERVDERFVLRDLRSKNRTRLNWEPLDVGGANDLRHGDIIGVGRSLLVFYDH